MKKYARPTGECIACHRQGDIAGRGMCAACYWVFNRMFKSNPDKIKEVIEWRKNNPVELRYAKHEKGKTCLVCNRNSVPVRSLGLCDADYIVLRSRYEGKKENIPQLIEWRKAHPVVVNIGEHIQRPTDFKNTGGKISFAFGKGKIELPEYIVRKSVAEYVEKCPIEEIMEIANSSLPLMMARVSFASGTPQITTGEQPKRTYTHRGGYKPRGSRYPREEERWSVEESDQLFDNWACTGSVTIDIKKNRKLAGEFGRSYESCLKKYIEVEHALKNPPDKEDFEAKEPVSVGENHN